MNLLVLRVHRIFRQRLKMLPAAQRADAPDVERMDGEIAAIAFAEHGPLRVGRLELAALEGRLAVRADAPLRNIKAAPVALRDADDDVHLVSLGGLAQFVGRRIVVAQGIVEIARDKSPRDRPRGRAEPNPPGVAGDPGFREGDQARARSARFIDQRDGLGDGGFEVEKGRRRLHRRHFVFRMGQSHGLLLT